MVVKPAAVESFLLVSFIFIFPPIYFQYLTFVILSKYLNFKVGSLVAHCWK